MCQLIETPQLSPHGIGSGKVLCLSAFHATVREVLFSKGKRRASGGMRSDGDSALHVRRVSETQPQAHVLQGTMESLKKAEKETQHFGVSVLRFVMLQTTCQLAKDDLFVGIPLGSGYIVGLTRTGGPQE